jgi:two-component system phosphate regulon response regulator PhoB
MLAANVEADCVARAKAAGVDEVVFKPWQKGELIARVNAALHRPQTRGMRDVLAHSEVELDRLSHKVRVQGTQVDLAPIEFRLLAYLMEHPGRVLDRQQLLEDVWNRRAGIGERTVDVHVRRLRAVLEPFGCDALIHTVRGFGYRFG